MDKRILNNLRENVGNAFSNNLGLKILAVVFATFLWWAVVNVDDPIQTKRFVVPVTVTNPEVITTAGKSFQLDDGFDTVTVTVKARRKVIEEMRSTSILAIADMRELQDSAVPVRVSIEGYEGQYESATPYPQNVQVNVEVTQTKTFPITALTTGEVRDGYVVAGTTVSPQSVDITGPTSLVSKISKVVAKVDVSGLAAGRKMTTTLQYYDAADNPISQTHLDSDCDETGVDVSVSIWEAKTVKVAFDTSLVKPADGYVFNGIKYEPETLRLAANAEIINTFTELSIPAEALAKDGITENEQVVIDVTEYLPEGVILADANASSVVVEIQVEQIGTKKFSVPVRSVKIDGLSDEFQLAYGPEQSVSIIFKGRSEALSALTEESFVASVDLSHYKEPGEYHVPVLISEQPEGCEYKEESTIHIILSVKSESDVPTEDNTETTPE